MTLTAQSTPRLALRLLGGQAAMVLAAGLVFAAFALCGIAPGISDDYRVRAAANLVLAAAVSAAVVCYARRWGGLQAGGFRFGFGRRDGWFVLAAAVMVLAVMCLYLVLLDGWGVRQASASPPALPALLLGVAGEFGVLHEEVLARGFFLPLLAAKWGPAAGVLLSAVLFSLGHLIFKKPDFMLVGHFLAGIVLGYAYLKSGTLLVPVLLHTAHNLGADLFLQGNDEGVSLGMAFWHFDGRLGAAERLPLDLVLALLQLVLIRLAYPRRTRVPASPAPARTGA
jgi:membrane protease YdiL (CAAX protease family)